MNLNVFYSWQSDRPNNVCRYLIRDAVKKAVDLVASDSTIEESPRLDHDTKGESGTPAIVETIFSKIEKAAVFVADVTFVGESNTPAASLKKLPNPNVLVELGYAAKAIGWKRIVCVFNESFGPIEDQIFDLKHRRNAICYHLDPDDKESRKTHLDQLANQLEYAIRSVLQFEHEGVNEVLAQLDPYSQTFLRMHANQEVISPRPINVFTLGAPANDLDTPSYNAAVDRLRQLGVIQAVTNPATHAVTFAWTHIGRMVLIKLGLRNPSTA